MRVVVVLSIVAISIQLGAAYAASPDASGVESLGRELLDDLTPNAVDDASAPPRGGIGNAGSTSRDPASPASRFDDLGEDIGQPPSALSLARVRQGMQQAESLLVQTKSFTDTGSLQQAGEAQEQVVAQLDQLIAELSKKCQGGQCQPSDQPPKPSQRSPKKPGKSGSAAGSGQTAARDSTARVDRGSAQAVDKGDLEAMVKDLWGHLPEREREQMIQSFSEEFLPKYELEIEQYYRRLSEENDENRPR